MTTRIQFFLFRAGALLVATSAFAQFGPPAASSAGSQANQVPLSGRTGQAGSVTATQSAVAGTTNSVNTINPSIQAAGPYTGSALSTTKMPFSGKLSLRDAIARGLEYNLGAVGLTSPCGRRTGRPCLSAAR